MKSQNACLPSIQQLNDFMKKMALNSLGLSQAARTATARIHNVLNSIASALLLGSFAEAAPAKAAKTQKKMNMKEIRSLRKYLKGIQKPFALKRQACLKSKRERRVVLARKADV